jgi:hypothetical protein
MIDPKFKNFRLVSSFIGWKQIVFIVEDYDKCFVSNVVEMPPPISPYVRIWNCDRWAKCWILLPWHVWDDC